MKAKKRTSGQGCRDISVRKDGELALRESERRLKQLIGNLPGFVYRGLETHGRWHHSYMSEGCREITGYAPQDFTGDRHLSCIELIPEPYREPIQLKWRKVLDERSVFEDEYPIRAASGETRWLWERGSGIYDGEALLFAEGFVTDITKRKKAEQALRESEAQNRALIEAIPDLIFTFSRAGEYLAVHASNPDLLFAPAAQILGRSTREILPGPLSEQFLRVIRDALERGAVQEFTYSLAIAGEEKCFEARVAPCATDTAIAIVRDVTERERAELEQRRFQSQVNQAMKMESLGCLAGGIAHDMNNVLGAILALASANIDALPAESRAHKAFATIIQAAERGGAVAQSLLRFVYQSPVEVRELDVNGLLREEVELLAHATLAKVRLVLDLTPELRSMRGDASTLTNAVMNLCVNAVDAMPEHGTLTLRTRNLDLDWISLQVEDTGCGMAKDVLEKAQDPFFTTKQPGKGTGLGLSMVYNTVKAHHGHLEIRSQPGQGTCVTMRFPAGPGLTRPKPPEAVPDPPAGPRSLRVLLADDDELIRSSLQELLEALGHTVTPVCSGEEALANLAAGGQADVVILDMNMPGLGGAGTLPRIRALRPAAPIIVATGRVDQTALDLAAAHPDVTLLSKPFSMKALQHILERTPAPGPAEPGPAGPNVD